MKSTLDRTELWDIIRQSKPSKLKPPDHETVANIVCSTLDIKKSEDIDHRISNEIKCYRKFMSAQKGVDSSKRKNIPGSNEIIFSSDNDNLTPQPVDNQSDIPPKKSRFRKSFESLSLFRKRDRTDELLNQMIEFVNEENKIRKEGTFTIRNLLGYFLYRTEYHSGDKKLAEFGIKLLNSHEGEDEVGGFDCTDAVTFMHDLTLTKEQMRTVKRYINAKGMFFPNTNDILKLRKTLRPKIHQLTDFVSNPSNLPGVAVDYKELIKQTTASVIDAVNYRSDIPINPLIEYRIYYKDGADGAGSQCVWKSKSMAGATANMYQYSIVPLRMESVTDTKTEVIWRNPAPNSPLSCRPQELIREKEDICADHSIPYTDRCRTEICAESLCIESFRDPGVGYQVKHFIYDTMKDMKFKKSISGLGGADCLLCSFKQETWMDIKQIEDGFPITTTADLISSLYDQLSTPDGEITKSKDDYELRRGLTQKPITSSDQWSICVTHSYINCTEWFIKLLARLNSHYHKWVEKSNCYGDHIRAGKERVRDIIETETGLRVNQICGALGKGGGSTDGNTGRRFFDQSSLKAILICVDSKYHEDLSRLHKNLSAILRIVSSKDVVNIVQYSDLLKSTSLLIANCYPWAQINYTLHGVIHHSLDLIVLNEGRGLGDLSEEALEANNKYVRRFLELYSRKISPQSQLEDVLGRLIERSDPYILERKLNFKPKKQICTECGSSKHSTKKHDHDTTMNDYDRLVNTILFSSF